MVDEQDKALRFYTEVPGFGKTNEIPMGEYRGLTVVSESDPNGAEIVPEPNAPPAAKTYQRPLFAVGIPVTAFLATNFEQELRADAHARSCLPERTEKRRASDGGDV